MKKIKYSDVFFLGFVFLQGIQIVVSLFFNFWLFLIILALNSVFDCFIIIFSKSIKAKVNRFLFGVEQEYNNSNSRFLAEIAIPCILTGKSGDVLWCNKYFRKYLSQGEEYTGESISLLLGSDTVELLSEAGQVDFELEGSFFSIRKVDYAENTLFYFIDETVSKELEKNYKLSKPVVSIIAIDSLDEVTRNLMDSDRVRISSQIQSTIEKWFADAHGIISSLPNDRFMLTFDEKSYRNFEKAKFSILEQIRTTDFGGQMPVTLSIGIGKGGNDLRECVDIAVQALDMALGRGGDQVAVKAKGSDYRFYGGVKAAAQTRTRVRTRIVASAMSELIAGSDNVILMGHKYSDLDCLGASFALLQTIMNTGKNVYIALNREESLAKPLLEYIAEKAPEIDSLICDDEELLPMITKKTLLIIVDTHRSNFVDYEEIYNACGNKVVIDHHRKSVDFIDDAVIFYHETAASSACEMVSELLQYVKGGKIGPACADALLSGIMLDTRNFVLHTGVRTFEAAAYLRRQGADPIKVKKLFSGTMPSYRQRVEIVGSAEVYGDCAIARNETNDADTRIATAQAADELLNINGIMASFVMCRAEDKINISARSLGEINVQLIMEKLGGGGHRIMAAAQVDTKSFVDARALLTRAIDQYYAEK